MVKEKYLVDLSDYSDEEFQRIWETLPRFDSFEQCPVYGKPKTFTVLWCEDRSMSELLGIPKDRIGRVS